MIIEDEDLLKTWIMKDVASLTDADADRLALYVIALLKKPLSDKDLVELCLDKLDVFLQNHTKDFVTRIFECIKESSYLPDETQADATDDIVLTEGSDQDEEYNVRKPYSREEKSNLNDNDNSKNIEHATTASDLKGLSVKADVKSNNSSARLSRRRISPPTGCNEREAVRYSRNGQTVRSPLRNRRGTSSTYNCSRTNRSDRYHRRRSWSRSKSRTPKSRSRSPHREKRREEHDGRRHRCRDFHKKGFCMRGDKCVYDHGPDPVVIENSALEKIVNRNTTTTAPTMYSPNPLPPGVDRVYSGVADAYNPEAPAITSSLGTTSSNVGKIDFTVPPPPLPSHLTSIPVSGVSFGSASNIASSSALVTVVSNVQPFNSASNVAPSALAGIPQDPSLSTNYIYGNVSQHQQFLPRRGASGRGRFKPYGSNSRVNPALCSLLVKKIPPEQNKIVMLDQHFGKFGQITNIHIQYEAHSDAALVTFKTRREALNAYRSAEPIFNNRFIKVYWQMQPPEQEEAETVTNGAATVPIQKTNEISTAPNTFVNNVVQQPLADISVQTNLNRPFSKTFTSGTEILEESNGKKTGLNDSDQKNAHILISEEKPVSKRPIYNPKAIAAQKKAEKENAKQLLEVHLRKTKLYQAQIEQQKDLLQKIQATENREIKKKYLELVKKTEEMMKDTKSEMEALSQQIALHQEKQGKEQTPHEPQHPTKETIEKGDDSTNEDVIQQSVIPDGQRKPCEQVTPAALLASLDEYEEEEDDNAENNILDDDDLVSPNEIDF